MALKKVTEYTGDVADPYGSQSQAEFTQNAFNQFGYLLQHQITNMMAINVVELLEMIDIDKQAAQGLVLA